MFMQEINNTHKLFDKVITEDLAQGYKLYALMDRSHLINEITEYDQEALFIGTRFKSAIEASPLLISLKLDDTYVVESMMNEYLGILLLSKLSIEQVRETLNQYLEVDSENLGSVYVRFYAPSVCLSLLNSEPELFYGFKVICPQITRKQWVYCDLSKEEMKKRVISISDITVQVMERYRLGAWLGLYERWQQKPSEELHRASIVIESLIKNGLQNQALLEEWRAFLADNLAIIDRPEWNSLLNQSLDDMGLYESAIQLAMVVKQSDDFTVREKN